jgi:hypothetical protein
MFRHLGRTGHYSRALCRVVPCRAVPCQNPTQGSDLLLYARVVGAENLRNLGRCSADRPVGLKLIFLIVSRAVSMLGLSRRESWWKDAEILMLRHQLSSYHPHWGHSSASDGNDRCSDFTFLYTVCARSSAVPGRPSGQAA